MRNLRELTRVLGRRNAVFGENTRFVSTTQTDIHAADGSLGIAKGRRAIIYSPSKTPMQSGVAQTLAGKTRIDNFTTLTNHQHSNTMLVLYFYSKNITSLLRHLLDHQLSLQETPLRGKFLLTPRENGSTL